MLHQIVSGFSSPFFHLLYELQRESITTDVVVSCNRESFQELRTAWTFLKHPAQDRQWTYYLTLRRVHETIVAVEKYYIFLCVCAGKRVGGEVCVRACVCGCEFSGAGVCLRACSLTNPARNVPPYCHLRPLINSRLFGKKVLLIVKGS
jgi:hypothetical protein